MAILFFMNFNKFHFYLLCEMIVGGSKTEISSKAFKVFITSYGFAKP